jgi:hypothetical protein
VDLETRADGETGPVSDPRDLIVGTIRPPDLLGRIPTLAWLFVALAAIGVAYPIWQAFRSGPDGISPTSLAFVLLSVVSGAATVLLPAAMLVGRRRLGSAGSWLLQGGIALAAAELLWLFGRDVVNGIAGSSSIDAEIASAISSHVVQSLAILVPVALLRMFGLAKIGLGLGAIAAPSRSLGRVAFAVLAASLAVVLVGDGLEIQVSKAQSATDTLLLTYNLLVLVTVLVVLGLWAWVASIAARRDGAPWRSIVVGSVAVVLGNGLGATGLLVALLQAGTDNAPTILIWTVLAAATVGAVGAAVLLVGFAQGFEPIDNGDGGEPAPGENENGAEPAPVDAPDADPVAHHAGA